MPPLTKIFGDFPSQTLKATIFLSLPDYFEAMHIYTSDHMKN